MDGERSRDASSVDYGELPELTRGLRALGSSRHETRSLQAQFFQPLLDARRKAADAKDPEGRIRAFDTRELTRQLERAIERIVSDWPDTRTAARRAVRAQLAERATPYLGALSELSESAARALAAAEADRLIVWRQWTTRLVAVFVTADRTWIALQSAARSLPPRSPR